MKRSALEGERGIPGRVRVDETSFQERHECVIIVCDQITGDVVYVADGRSKEALGAYLRRFSEKELKSLESIAMDMRGAYISVVQECGPEAEEKMCFNKFHVTQHLGKAVDKVRRREHKRLL